MKFAMAFSGGKDSALALWHMQKLGHKPICLIFTINKEQSRSWFHGIDINLIKQMAANLRIPLLLCYCNGDDYLSKFIACLKKAKDMGASACAFGDIDIASHGEWNQKCCQTANLKCVMPLWQKPRAEVVQELIDNGFKAIIKVVENQILPQQFLGKVLDKNLAQEIVRRGADICGENGEYHTLVIDGPIFYESLVVNCKKPVDLGNYSAIDIKSSVEQDSVVSFE